VKSARVRFDLILKEDVSDEEADEIIDAIVGVKNMSGVLDLRTVPIEEEEVEEAPKPPEHDYREPHEWEEAPGMKDGKRGVWSECSKCHMRFFYPEGFTEFQRTITRIVGAGDYLPQRIKDDGFRSELTPPTEEDEYNPTAQSRGAHADMADFCDYARDKMIEDVQTS